jgi:putative selenium metabolism protein SsnA
MSEFIIGKGIVVTLGKKNRIIHNGAVYIKNDKIVDVGKTEELRLKYKKCKFIDASGKIIMPGMICTHHHLYSTMARGMNPPGEPAANFVQILERLWWKLDYALNDEDIYYSAIMPYIECIRNGTTTIIDHHASPSCRDGSLDIIEKAARKVGIRSCLCYEVSDRNVQGAGIPENVRFIKKCQKNKDPMISAMFGLHASFTCSNKTLEKCVAENESLNAGFHIHVAEDLADRKDSMKKYKMPTVTRLLKQGIGGEKSLFVHCIHINDTEMGQLAESETTIIHNPESNMNNAVGVSKVLDMIDKGILIGLGTDGMTSNMFLQMRVAYLLQKLDKKDPRVAFCEAPQMLLWNNPKIAMKYFPVKLGEISKGAVADVILVDYDPITPLNADNFLGHFIFGLYDAKVDTTICNGKILMKNKKLCKLDSAALASKTAELAKKMWKRLK